MNILSENDVSIVLGQKIIISNSKIILNNDSKIGLIGNNGCGKTTLLNYIYEHKLLDNYEKYIVNQHIKYESEEQTVLDFMLQTNMNVYNINKKISSLDIENENNDNLIEYQTLIQTPEYEFYDKYLSDCKRILNGLSIINHDDKISTYSGGWKMKLSIAKALITNPDILIMDEPTNHLDYNAISWLGDFLETYSKCLIITSHQIDFINNFSNQIWYIGAPDFRVPKLYSINGNYDKLTKTLNDIKKKAISDYEKLNNKINEMKKHNKSKIDIQKYITNADIPRPPKDINIKISFPDIDFINSNQIIQFHNVNFGYDKPILINSDFGISLNDRVAIIGPNGTGKTTLFKLCMGELHPLNGEIIRDNRVKIGYYNQEILKNLPLDITPFEYIKRLDHTLSIEHCRKILSKVGINECYNIIIDKLSGGQKARVCFCAIQVKKPNIILLDEPTNHLDIETLEGLIEGINDYNGGIIMITHDSYFINSINNIRMLKMENGLIKKLN